MDDIDLESPGKITASANNAKDYVFYIVKAKAWYNEKAFQANPNCVAGKDLFFKSDVLPDQGGKAEFDLTAKADALKHLMKDEGKIRVKVVTLTTAKSTNDDPNARLAVVEPCDLRKIPPTIEISTDGDKREFVVGTKLGMKFLVKGLDEAVIRCEPPGAFTFPKDKLSKTEFLDITADKAIKGVVYCSGISIGGNKIEAKIEIEAVGPSLVIDAIGYNGSGNERDVSDYVPPPPVPKPSLDVTIDPADLKQVAFNEKATLNVDFANLDSVQIAAEPPDAVALSVNALSSSGKVEVTAQKDAHVKITVTGGSITKTFEFDTVGPPPKLTLAEPAVSLGAAAKLTLEGPAGEDHTLVFIPDDDTAKKGMKQLDKKSPLGKFGEDGVAKGELKLGSAEFKSGKYKLILKSAAGRESEPVDLEVKPVAGVLVADAGASKLVIVDPLTGAMEPLADTPFVPFAGVRDQKGRVFATLSRPGSATLHEIDVSGGGKHRLVAEGFNSNDSLCVDPESNDIWMVSVYENAVYKINPDSGAKEVMAKGAHPYGIALAENFVFYTTGDDKKLWALDKKTKRLEDVVTFPAKPWGIAFGEGGAKCFVGGDGKIWEVDLKERKIAREFAGTEIALQLFALDEKTILFSQYYGKPLHKLDLESGKITALDAGTKDARGIAPSDKPHPKYKSGYEPTVFDCYVAGSNAHCIRQFDTKSGRMAVLASGISGEGSYGVCFGKDGMVYSTNIRERGNYGPSGRPQSSSSNGSIARIDPETGALKDIVQPINYPMHLCVDPDSGDLFVAEDLYPGRILRVNPADGKFTAVYTANASYEAQGVALLGDVLLFTEYDKPQISAIHLNEKNRLEVFMPLPGGNPGSITPSLKGDEVFVVGGGGVIWRIDLAQRKVVKKYAVADAVAVGVQSDGKLLVGCGGSGLFRLDPESGAATKVFGEPCYQVWPKDATTRKYPSPPKIEYSLFAATSTNGVIRQYSPATGFNSVLASGLSEVVGVTVGKDGAVYTGCVKGRSTDGTIARIDKSTGKVTDVVKGVVYPTGMCPDPDSNDLFVIEHFAPGRVMRVSPDNGKITELYNPGSRNDGMGVALLGDVLLFCERTKAQLSAIHLSEKNRVEVFMPLPGAPDIITPGLKGDEIFVSSLSGHIWRIDVAKRAVVKTYDVPSASSVAVLPDGKLLVAAYSNGLFRLDPESGATEKIDGNTCWQIWLSDASARKYPAPPKLEGDFYAAGGYEQSIRQINSKTGWNNPAAQGLNESVGGVCVGTDGNIYAANHSGGQPGGGRITKIDKDTGKATDLKVAALCVPVHLFPDPDSNDLFVSEFYAPGRILRVNTADGSATVLHTTGGDSMSVALVGDVLLYSTTSAKTISAIWLKEGNRVESFMTMPAEPRRITPSLKGDQIYVTGPSVIWRCDLAKRAVVKKYDVPGVAAVGVLDDGKLLVSGKGTLLKLDPETGEKTKALEATNLGNFPGDGGGQIWIRGAEKRKYASPPSLPGKLVGVSIPPGSTAGDCAPQIQGIWSMEGGIDVSKGIGNILFGGGPAAPSAIPGGFSLHDHVGATYQSPNVPQPGRAQVTYHFDRPTAVAQLEVMEHANGIIEVEGFVGDDPNSLASIGKVVGSLGAPEGPSVFKDGDLNVFDFKNAKAGSYFRFVVTRTPLANGWAIFRAFPRDKDGKRLEVAAPSGGIRVA